MAIVRETISNYAVVSDQVGYLFEEQFTGPIESCDVDQQRTAPVNFVRNAGHFGTEILGARRDPWGLRGRNGCGFAISLACSCHQVQFLVFGLSLASDFELCQLSEG